MKLKMTADLLMNRDISVSDYISPGGYSFITKDNKLLKFDFYDFFGNIDRSQGNQKVLNCEMRNLDIDSFPDAKFMTIEDLKDIKRIIEFFIYTESAENPMLLKLERIMSLCFYVEENNEEIEINVPQNVLEQFYRRIKSESGDDPDSNMGYLLNKIDNEE